MRGGVSAGWTFCDLFKTTDCIGSGLPTNGGRTSWRFCIVQPSCTFSVLPLLRYHAKVAIGIPSSYDRPPLPEEEHTPSPSLSPHFHQSDPLCLGACVFPRIRALVMHAVTLSISSSTATWRRMLVNLEV